MSIVLIFILGALSGYFIVSNKALGIILLILMVYCSFVLVPMELNYYVFYFNS